MQRLALLVWETKQRKRLFVIQTTVCVSCTICFSIVKRTYRIDTDVLPQQGGDCQPTCPQSFRKLHDASCRSNCDDSYTDKPKQQLFDRQKEMGGEEILVFLPQKNNKKTGRRVDAFLCANQILCVDEFFVKIWPAQHERKASHSLCYGTILT